MTQAISRGYVPGPHGQLHYRQAGPQGAVAGRPLVLFHQNPSSSFEFEVLMAELARDRRVLAFDTPGYGMSDGPSEPLSMAGYAGILADALPAVGIDSALGCDVYGFHTGALIAVEVALARPDLVRAVALTGLPMRSPEERAERLAAARNPTPLDEAGETAMGLARRLWDFVVVNRSKGVTLARAAENWIDKLRTLDRITWAYVGVWSFNFEARMPLLKQPVLLLQPHEEILRQSIAAVALCPDHRVVEMPEWSRDIFDIPEAVTRIGEELRRFLDQSH
ncbi:MAG: alpha/beta fold hydrolase [Azospirillaceae bacterium]|nr:alpha/beta fold hydrolase [Azospirillaceae bacterium]